MWVSDKSSNDNTYFLCELFQFWQFPESYQEHQKAKAYTLGWFLHKSNKHISYLSCKQLHILVHVQQSLTQVYLLLCIDSQEVQIYNFPILKSNRKNKFSKILKLWKHRLSDAEVQHDLKLTFAIHICIVKKVLNIRYLLGLHVARQMNPCFSEHFLLSIFPFLLIIAQLSSFSNFMLAVIQP